MQSPFSFRRFAPAFDYLGSPFSAFFRPLLLGFRSTLSRFPTSFFRSTFTFFRQLLSRFRLLSVLFFFSALFPVLLTAAPRCSSVSFVPFVFPLPSRLISHAFLPVLLTQLSCIVSFRSTLLRSRSRSAGAHLSLSLKMSLHGFRSLSIPLALGLSLLSFCFFISSFPLFPPHSWLFQLHGFAFARRSPLSSSLVSRAFRPILSTLLSVCFLSSFPASLPQPFHRCFPFGFLLRDRCLTSAFFRPLPF